MEFWIARDWDGLTLFQSESEPQLTDDYLWYDNGDGWFYEVINISSGKSLVEDYEDDMIQSYEEAALAGIDYVLNNLI